MLAANSVIRSLFGVGTSAVPHAFRSSTDPPLPAFPLFTTQMYHNLGVNWATTLVAFLSLACAPLPVYVPLTSYRTSC